MKTVLILAALLAAFGVVGAVDYDTATGLAAEYSRPAAVAALRGER